MADSPFQKNESVKYYPEIHLISGKGEVLATINPSTRTDNRYGALEYCEGFRDDKLKINDDRKVKMTLSDFANREDIVIVLTVRTNDLKGQKVDPALYNKAWFRLQNEETNQTLDYTYVNDVKKQGGEEGGEEEEEPEEEEEEENEDGATPREKPETIILCGRIFNTCGELLPDEIQEKQPKSAWVYERWNQTIKTDAFPNIQTTLAKMHAKTLEDKRSYKKRIE